MNSLNILIFSGGEIAGFCVTCWTGQQPRHSPHWVHASISIRWDGVSPFMKESLFFMHQMGKFFFPLTGLEHGKRCSEDMRRQTGKEDEEDDKMDQKDRTHRGSG